MAGGVARAALSVVPLAEVALEGLGIKLPAWVSFTKPSTVVGLGTGVGLAVAAPHVLNSAEAVPTSGLLERMFAGHFSPKFHAPEAGSDIGTTVLVHPAVSSGATSTARPMIGEPIRVRPEGSSPHTGGITIMDHPAAKFGDLDRTRALSLPGVLPTAMLSEGAGSDLPVTGDSEVDEVLGQLVAGGVAVHVGQSPSGESEIGFTRGDPRLRELTRGRSGDPHRVEVGLPAHGKIHRSTREWILGLPKLIRQYDSGELDPPPM